MLRSTARDARVAARRAKTTFQGKPAIVRHYSVEEEASGPK
jgi:hypothetical protein